jgi:hypothetical protein
MYHERMRGTVLAFLLPVALTAVQTATDPDHTAAINRLQEVLASLRTPSTDSAALNQRLANEILLAAEPLHRPSRTAAASLADRLRAALGARRLSARQVTQLAADTAEVLRSAGLATYRLDAALDRIQENLLTLGVPAPSAVGVRHALSVAANEVRGPQDLGVQRTR